LAAEAAEGSSSWTGGRDDLLAGDPDTMTEDDPIVDLR